MGQRAELKIRVTNDAQSPIIIHGSAVHFHRTSKTLTASHSMLVDPLESRVIIKHPVTIGPWAERAGATCTLSIAYTAAEDSSWGGRESRKFPQGGALTIADARPTGRKIFISHSNRERDRAVLKAAERAARKAGLEPYVSEKDPKLGANLWEKILEQVRDCDGFLVLLTMDGDKSCDMREELGYVRMRNAIAENAAVGIVPVVEKGVEPSGSLKGMEYKEIDLDKPQLAADEIAEMIIDSFVGRVDQT